MAAGTSNGCDNGKKVHLGFRVTKAFHTAFRRRLLDYWGGAKIDAVLKLVVKKISTGELTPEMIGFGEAQVRISGLFGEHLEALAKESKVPSDRVIAIRDGDYPNPDELVRLARVLEVATEDLKNLFDQRLEDG